MGAFHAVNSAFTGVLYTVTIVGGGYFVATGGLAVTDLAIYALYIGIFLSPIEQLINFTEQFQKGYAGFRRFMEVLAVLADIADAPDAVDLAVAERGRQGTKGAAGEEGGVQGLPRGGASGAVGAGRASKGNPTCAGTCATATCISATTANTRSCAAWTWTCRRVRPWRSWGRAAAARPRRARSCRGSTTRQAARWRSTASTSARSP